MNYIRISFTIEDRYQEFFIAELMDLDFYGFEQFDDQLVAYVEKPRYNDTHREYIEQLIAAWPGASFQETEDIEEQNWNQTWEQSIQPQRIGPFLVKPTWSAEMPAGDEILLEIDPKMAFGTGYHATTRLMLKQLNRLETEGKKILDAGTGTGILAIASVKLGAAYIVGFDVDPWSEVNAKENTLLNKTDEHIDIRFGGIEQVRDDEIFDITLANINRNVILEMIPDLIKHTRAGGTICLSGLLDSDEDIIRAGIENEPVDVVDLQQEEEWILFQLEKVS